MFKDFVLSDLKMQGVTEKDIDILMKTHAAVAHKDFIQRNDMKAIFEGAWNEATQFVFEQQAAQ